MENTTNQTKPKYQFNYYIQQKSHKEIKFKENILYILKKNKPILRDKCS